MERAQQVPSPPVFQPLPVAPSAIIRQPPTGALGAIIRQAQDFLRHFNINAVATCFHRCAFQKLAAPESSLSF